MCIGCTAGSVAGFTGVTLKRTTELADLALVILGSIVWSAHRFFPADIWTEGLGAGRHVVEISALCGIGTALISLGIFTSLCRAVSIADSTSTLPSATPTMKDVDQLPDTVAEDAQMALQRRPRRQSLKSALVAVSCVLVALLNLLIDMNSKNPLFKDGYSPARTVPSASMVHSKALSLEPWRRSHLPKRATAIVTIMKERRRKIFMPPQDGDGSTRQCKIL